MTGIRAVQAFRRERRNDEIFGELNAGYYDASLRSFRLVALYAPGITLVGNVITGVVLGYGGLRVIDGDIKVGVLVTFLLYLRRFFDPLQDLAQFYNAFQAAGAALEKISGVLAEPPSVPSPARGVRLPDRRGSGRGVRFASVGFGYRTEPVIATSTWTSRPGRRRRWWAPPVRARRRWPGCWPGSTTRTRGGCCLTGWTCGIWTTRRCDPR